VSNHGYGEYRDEQLALVFAVAIAGAAALVLIGTTRGRLGWRPELASEATALEPPKAP